MNNPGRALRGLTARRVIAAFERAGYTIDRTRGSHVVLEHPGRRSIVIPRHDPVPHGLLLSKIKDAGLTPEEFVTLL